MNRFLPVLFFAALLGGCGGGDNSEPPKTYTVDYVVTGSLIGDTASATYRSALGATEQREVKLPATITRYAVKEDEFLYISAQKPVVTGSISVAIRVDGVTWKSATSTAPYGIASVDGSCCK